MTIVMLAPSAVPASEADYAARRCEEQELLDLHPELVDAPDARLIELVTDEYAAALLGDPDDVAAVAAILLERRLSGTCPRRPN